MAEGSVLLALQLMGAMQGTGNLLGPSGSIDTFLSDPGEFANRVIGSSFETGSAIDAGTFEGGSDLTDIVFGGLPNLPQQFRPDFGVFAPAPEGLGQGQASSLRNSLGLLEASVNQGLVSEDFGRQVLNSILNNAGPIANAVTQLLDLGGDQGGVDISFFDPQQDPNTSPGQTPTDGGAGGGGDGGGGGIDLSEQIGQLLTDFLGSDLFNDLIDGLFGGDSDSGIDAGDLQDILDQIVSGGGGGGGAGGGGGSGGFDLSDVLTPILVSAIGAGIGAFGDEGDPAQAGTINPAFPRIAEAFGVGTDLTDSGLFVPEGSVPASIFSDNNIDKILSFLQNPVGLTEADQTGLGILAGDPGTGALADTFRTGERRFDDLLGVAVPSTAELIETGRPTAIDPIVEASTRRFEEEFLPQLFERLPTGTLSASGIPAIASREASRLATELGQLEFEASENAAARSLNALSSALPTVSTVNTASGLFPLSFASDLMNVGSQARQSQEDVRPGGRLFNAFTTLAGMGPSQVVTQGAEPSDLSQILSALSQTVPAVTAATGGGSGSGSSGFTNPFSTLFG